MVNCPNSRQPSKGHLSTQLSKSQFTFQIIHPQFKNESIPKAHVVLKTDFSVMRTMNLKPVFSIVCLILIPVDSKFHSMFLKVECNASMKSTIKPFCFLKTYKRNNALLNIGYELKRVVSDGMVRTSSKCFKNFRFIDVISSLI
jgi:hypothetical protein